MRTLEWQGPMQMALVDRPVPVLAPGEVQLKVTAVGICGSELEGYVGNNSLRTPPLVMGHELTGRVIDVADGLDRSWLGQSVAVNPLLGCGSCRACLRGQTALCPSRRIIGVHRPGGFAEHVAVPAASLVLLPSSLPAAVGALTEPTAVALRAVRKAGVEIGQTVVVLGCGTIGLLLVQLSRAAGARVVGVDTAPARLELAQALGADAIYQFIAGTDAAQEILARTARENVDVVFDGVGHSTVRQLALRLVRPGGRVLMIGLHEASTQIDVNDLIRWEVQLMGSFAYSPFEFADAARLLGEGRVTTEGWTITAPLAEGSEWFARLSAGQLPAPKVVLIP